MYCNILQYISVVEVYWFNRVGKQTSPSCPQKEKFCSPATFIYRRCWHISSIGQRDYLPEETINQACLLKIGWLMLGNLYVSLPMKIIQKYELLSVSLEFNSISRLFENLEIRCMLTCLSDLVISYQESFFSSSIISNVDDILWKILTKAYRLRDAQILLGVSCLIPHGHVSLVR